uniref:Ig-like domain-containing protein n=1 Tax=Colobus angolensis palliatus TaxID=336983 RepID=A0A2K5HCI5_COLAP
MTQIPQQLRPDPASHRSVSVSAGSISQPVLTQPPSLSASPGATARLPCTLSSDLSVGSKNMYWYQQKPGSAPSLFLYYYSDSDKQLGPGVPSRVSGSKETSSNTAFLLISGLQPEDEADYYCQVYDSSANHSERDR